MKEVTLEEIIKNINTKPISEVTTYIKLVKVIEEYSLSKDIETVDQFYQAQHNCFSQINICHTKETIKKEDETVSNLLYALKTLHKIEITKIQEILQSPKDIGKSTRTLINTLRKKLASITGDFEPPKKPPKLFQGKQSESLAFLEKYYGKYLKYFGAEQDRLFQYQLAKLDPKLARAIRGTINYQRRKNKSELTYTQVVPPKKKETDQIFATTLPQAIQASIAIHSRRYN